MAAYAVARSCVGLASSKDRAVAVLRGPRQKDRPLRLADACRDAGALRRSTVLTDQLFLKLMAEAVVWPFLSTSVKASLMLLPLSVITEEAVP